MTYGWEVIFGMYVALCQTIQVDLDKYLWDMPVNKSASIVLATSKFKEGDKNIGLENLPSRQKASGMQVADLLKSLNKGNING